MKGFTLIEILITISLIGIIASLLIPSLSQAQAEANRQAVRHQVKVLETALANWYAAQPSLQEASAIWDANCSNNDGYINSNGFSVGTLLPKLATYLDATHNFTAGQDANQNGYIDTPQMQQIVANQGGYKDFIQTTGTDVDVSGILTTHARLYWDPAQRTTTSPRVVLFIPEYDPNP